VDAASYASDTEGCSEATVVGFDCAEPFECPEGLVCSLLDNRCRPPMPTPNGCCFFCDAPPSCDLCEGDSDCRLDGECSTELGGGPTVCLTKTCETDVDCPADLECVVTTSAETGYCRQPCNDDADCMDQYACGEDYCFGTWN
jgi:hypothetical protein